MFGGSSSFSIIESMQQVVVDIRFYLMYLLLMMWGFACAYCVLFRRDQEHEVGSALSVILAANHADMSAGTLHSSSMVQGLVL